MVRIISASLMIAAALFSAPSRAADLAGVWAGAVHAEPFVVYDYEPGIVVRTYWLQPWAGRHYFPSGSKMPVVGRREQLAPTPVSSKRNYERNWSSFPVDTIEQPPLILNQQQYFPSNQSSNQPSNKSSSEAAPPVLK